MSTKMIVFVVLLMASFAFAQIPTNGLVAYYPFNGNANDESGNGNNGTVKNGTALTNDRFGKLNRAYKFDGVDDYVDCGNGATLNFTSSLTMSFWILFDTNPYSISDPGTRMIIDKAYSWRFYYIPEANGNFLYADQVYSDLWNWDILNTTVSTWQTNKWYHIAVTFGNSGYRIYVAGILENSSNLNKMLYTSSYPLFIGAQSDGPGSYFQGCIDDVAIYDRELSAEEIQELYNDNQGNESILVQGNEMWTDSRIFLEAGNSFTVSPSGIWYGAPGYPYDATGARGGYPGMSMHPNMCLLGKIDDKVFYVGMGGSITMPGSGILYLGPNDGPTADCWGDNSGALSCDVNGTIISVIATDEWTTTNNNFSQGQNVTITPSDIWYGAPGYAYDASGDRGGYPGMSAHPNMCLIGKIGASVFYIGSGGIITAPESGTLYLGPNDGPTADCWGDNSGYLNVNVFYDVNTKVISNFDKTPDDLVLFSNYPNPFNPSTQINYELQVRSQVKLEIYNVIGQRVDEMLFNEQEAGVHQFVWRPNGDSGIYFCRLEATPLQGDAKPYRSTIKMTFTK